MILTRRIAVFFVGLAAANEVVWRNFSTDTWVSFKVWGIMPLTMIFAMAQTPQAPAAQPSQAEQGGPPPIPNFLRRTA